MPHNTRQAILNVSKQLFSERGYNGVSMRDIAEALGISKGNLTYHFKKKEDIVDALLLESPNARPYELLENFRQLDDFFLDIETVVRENAFYFWHHAQLAQVSPKVRTLQNDAFNENSRILSDAIRKFTQEGLIAAESYPGEHRRMVDTLIALSVYWIPFCDLKGTGNKEFRVQAWSTLYPLLTSKGKKAFAELGVKFG